MTDPRHMLPRLTEPGKWSRLSVHTETLKLARHAIDDTPLYFAGEELAAEAADALQDVIQSAIETWMETELPKWPGAGK